MIKIDTEYTPFQWAPDQLEIDNIPQYNTGATLHELFQNYALVNPPRSSQRQEKKRKLTHKTTGELTCTLPTPTNRKPSPTSVSPAPNSTS